MRIIVGPVEVSGVAYSLVKAFRELGEQAELVLGVSHPFSYGKESSSFIFNFWRDVGTARSSCSRSSFFKKITLVSLHKLVGWICFILLLPRVDVFLFTYGSTFTDSCFELFIIKLLKKKIYFIYFGSEARPPIMDGVLSPLSLDDYSLSGLFGATRRSRKRVRVHERFADLIVNSPATGHYHTRPFVNWFSLGVPVGDFDSGVSPSCSSACKPVRILHSPSHPFVKGTSLIEAAINNLVRKGYSIEFIKLVGVSNDVVLNELAVCDFVVDQVFSDTPMAVFAAEAAKFGKPSVVAGYFSEYMAEYVEGSDSPPVLFVSPEDLERSIERLIVDVRFRRELGANAKDFLSGHWSALAVANRYLSLFRGDFPQEWLVDPYSISYIFGGGLSKQRLKENFESYIDKFGIGAMGFEDKPELETAILNFISNSKGLLSDA